MPVILTKAAPAAAEEATSVQGRRVALAAGLVMGAFVLSRVLGLVRQQVFNIEFGTTAEMDAFWAAFRIPDALYQLIAGGALGSAFIPVFAGLLAQREERRAWAVASTVLNTTLLGMLAAAALALVGAPQLVRWMVPGYAPSEQALVTWLTRLLLVQPIFLGVSGVLMAALNSYNRFLLPALAPSAYNLAIIAAALFLGSRLGVSALAFGVVAGAALQVAIQVPPLLQRRVPYRLALDWRDPHAREVLRLLVPRLFALGALQVNFVLSTFLASRLAAGALTGFTNAFQLMLLPQGIFAMAVSTAAFPTLAAQSARGELDDLAHTLQSSLRLVLFLTIPAGVALIALRAPLVQALFQYGAFDQASTALTTWPLLFFAVGLLGHAGVEVLLRAFYALHETLRPVVVNCATLTVNAALSFALVGPLAQGGLALAMSVGVTLEMLALLWLLRGRLPALRLGALAGEAGKQALAALLMGAVLWALVAATGGAQATAPLARSGRLALLLAAGGAAYLATAAALGCTEAALVARLGQALLRRVTAPLLAGS